MVDLGLMSDPDKELVEEAEEIISSGEVVELCQSVGIDCEIVEAQKEDVLEMYDKLKEKPRKVYSRLGQKYSNIAEL